MTTAAGPTITAYGGTASAPLDIVLADTPSALDALVTQALKDAEPAAPHGATKVTTHTTVTVTVTCLAETPT